MGEPKKKGILHIWVYPEELDELTALCKEIGQSKQTVVRSLILEEIQRHHMDRITRPWGMRLDGENVRHMARVSMPPGRDSNG